MQEIHEKNTCSLSKLHNDVIPSIFTLFFLTSENRIKLRIFSIINKNQAKVIANLFLLISLDRLPKYLNSYKNYKKSKKTMALNMKEIIWWYQII